MMVTKTPFEAFRDAGLWLLAAVAGVGLAVVCAAAGAILGLCVLTGAVTSVLIAIAQAGVGAGVAAWRSPAAAVVIACAIVAALALVLLPPA